VPQLDGLRAVAVLAVVAFHARVPWLSGGFLGVDVFFVLSGFLITQLLAQEYARNGRIALIDFYLRRLRRLYPALLAMLAAYLVAAPFAFPEHDQHPRDAAVAALYLSDYGRAFFEVPWYLQHTWSLSVEEHFYLVWPLALLAVFRLPKRWHVPAVILLAVAATVWRLSVVLWVDQWYQPYYRFDTRLSGLMLGSALALWRPKMHAAAGAAGVAMLAAALVSAQWRMLNGLIGWAALAEIGSALLVITAHKLPGLGWSPLVWVGKLSYGIYLWHYPIAYWFRANDYGWATTALTSLVLSILMAAISYATVERSYRLSRAHRVERPGIGEVSALGGDPSIGKD